MFCPQALELAVQATQACEFKDWYWKIQLGKCYFLLGLIRDAEQQFHSALKQHQVVETFLRLARVYVRLDQPLSALDVCKRGIEYFPGEVTLTTEMARYIVKNLVINNILLWEFGVHAYKSLFLLCFNSLIFNNTIDTSVCNN
jgi:hypothetical protein